MKQVILLEPREVYRLQKGKQLEIATPGGTLVIGFDRNGAGTDDSTCAKCGKVLKNAHGLSVHMLKKHGVRGK